MKYAILNESGDPVPCDLLAWVDWIQIKGQRIIQQETINGYFVSTVFVGCFVIFETMIFDCNENEIFCRRTETRLDALAAHQNAKEMIKTGKFKLTLC